MLFLPFQVGLIVIGVRKFNITLAAQLAQERCISESHAIAAVRVVNKYGTQPYLFLTTLQSQQLWHILLTYTLRLVRKTRKQHLHQIGRAHV